MVRRSLGRGWCVSRKPKEHGNGTPNVSAEFPRARGHLAEKGKVSHGKLTEIGPRRNAPERRGPTRELKRTISQRRTAQRVRARRSSGTLAKAPRLRHFSLPKARSGGTIPVWYAV